MKITDIVVVLHKATTDMQAFAARNGDLDFPDQLVLPFIMNFLTDERLRKLSAEGQRLDFRSKDGTNGAGTRAPAHATLCINWEKPRAKVDLSRHIRLFFALFGTL
jgi:hypothetical protein